VRKRRRCWRSRIASSRRSSSLRTGRISRRSSGRAFITCSWRTSEWRSRRCSCWGGPGREGGWYDESWSLTELSIVIVDCNMNMEGNFTEFISELHYFAVFAVCGRVESWYERGGTFFSWYYWNATSKVLHKQTQPILLQPQLMESIENIRGQPENGLLRFLKIGTIALKFGAISLNWIVGQPFSMRSIQYLNVSFVQ
jgi:hypothetical protein